MATSTSTSSSPPLPLLSPDDLAEHVQTCQVIFAMWGGEGELQIEPGAERAIEGVSDDATGVDGDD